MSSLKANSENSTFILHFIKKKNYDKPIVVSPDTGGVARARAFAKSLNVDMAIIDKRRPKANVAEVMNIIGDVEGKTCIIVDDMVDSGGTLCNAASALINQGAKTVSAYITHGVLSQNAWQKIANSQLQKLIITNSINPTAQTLTAPNIEIIDISFLLATAINNIACEKSLSALFN